MESCKMSIAFLVILCLFGAVIQVTAQNRCETCMVENNAYCMNTTHFHPCYDGKTPEINQIFKCPDGQECTDDTNICVVRGSINGNTVNSVCAGSTASCNICAIGTKKFACVSRTQYSLCVASTPQPAAQSCGPNEICSLKSLAAGAPICVPECAANFLQYQPSCSNDVTTPKPPPPTNAPIYTGLAELCAVKCATKPNELCYTYNKNLADCKSYIGCEKRTNEDKWDFFILQCPAGQFWKTEGGGCSTATCVPPP